MQTVPEIDARAAKQLHDGNAAIFVDIRDAASHAGGHVPGARHATTQQDVDALCADLNPDQTLVVYCYHGNASRGAVAYLAERGFVEARSLIGGFEAWRREYETEP